MTPVLNTIIRINESEADAFGLDAAREPDGFASIAMKLSEYRKIEPGAAGGGDVLRPSVGPDPGAHGDGLEGEASRRAAARTQRADGAADAG